MEKGIQILWNKHGQRTKTKYNEVNLWMSSHPDWPPMSSQPLVKKEKVVSNTPNDKSYPFTVEVIAENEHNALDKKLDFAPPASILEGKNNLQEETHANAAMVLNSTAVS